MRKKIIRLTTVSGSLITLKGQLGFLNKYYEVIAVSSGKKNLDIVSKMENIRTIDINLERRISLKQDIISLISLVKLFYSEKPHIVHANTPKASLLGMVAAWITRVPHRIYTVTGLRFETTHGLFRFLLKSMERITCLAATKVIPEGDGVRNTLYKEHITRKPLQKIHNGNINGIDVDYFDRTEDVLSRASKLRKSNLNEIVFIFIGRIVRDKGINELISAFDQLSSEHNNVRLLLVGRFENELDPIEPKTKRIIEENTKICYMGFQSDVRPYLAASDILILPSYREGFPNVVLQAGAMGLPCIVSDISGCNEIIQVNYNGIIVPKQDVEALYTAMLHLVMHPDLIHSMSTVSRDLVVSRYLRSDIWKATLEMYKLLQ